MVFKNNISAVLDAYGRNKIKALNYLGAFIVEEAKKRCPVLTGNLKSSIGYRVENDRVVIYATADYAIWVHEGTWKMPARRFINDAVYDNTHMIKNIIIVTMKAA